MSSWWGAVGIEIASPKKVLGYWRRSTAALLPIGVKWCQSRSITPAERFPEAISFSLSMTGIIRS